MRVWFINHYALPPERAGGTRHYSLAKNLIHRGHQVVIIASSVDYMQRREVVFSANLRAHLQEHGGVPFLWLKTPPYRGNTAARVWNMWVFAGRVLQLAPQVLSEPPDVILGSSPHPFAAWAAARLAARFRAPFVFEVRDLWPQSLIELGRFSSRHPFIMLLAYMERFLYRRATRIVTLLPGAAAYIRARGGEAEKIVWIPNGLDLSLVPPPSPPLQNGVFTIMYAGAHGRANGLEVVLEAARLLQERSTPTPIRFVLIGDGPEKPNLQAQTRSWGLQNVVFEDPIPKGEIYKRLQEADAFLMILRPSPVFRWGVSPNKLFDYMAMARPVLFCIQTPYNPVAEAKAGITVPPGDAKSLARAILHLIELSPEERWHMGLRGRDYVEKNHAMTVLAQRLERTLQEAIRDFSMEKRP